MKAVSPEEEAEAGRLLHHVSIGDETAFNTLAGRYRGLMIHSALRVVNNVADAEDAVQDALLVLWQRCREYMPIESPIGLLVAMPRRAAMNIIHKRHAMKRGGPHPELHDEEMRMRLLGIYGYRRAGLESQMIERAPELDPLRKMGMVHRLLGEVPPVFVGMLDAFFFQGKDEADLAAERGDTPNGIRRALHDGLEVIRYLVNNDPENTATA